MSDLISRDALMEYARNHIGHTVDCNDIARFPAANIKCGTWETFQFYDADGNPVYMHCHPECKYQTCTYDENGTPYCPNCGTKMNVEENYNGKD